MTTFENIKDILLLLHQTSGIGIKEISDMTKKSRSVVSNALPILYELQLIEQTGVHNVNINITKSGTEMSTYLKMGNTEKIKELALLILPRSKILTEAYKILKEKPTVSSYELGFNLHKLLTVTRPWNEKTYVIVGRTCKYILDGFQLVPYEGGTVQRTKRKHRGRLKDKVIPSTSAGTILDMIDRFFNNNDEWQITNLGDLPSKQQSLLNQVNSLVDLGIVEFIDHVKNIIKLTAIGKKLRYASNKIEREMIFQEILIQYPPLLDIIKIIAEMKMELGYTEIGNILENYNNCHYSDVTKKDYGMRLIGWLRMGNILEENSEWGKYHLSKNFIEMHKNLFTKEKQRIITDTAEIKIDLIPPNTEKIIGEIHRYCNRILHTEKNDWDISLKEKIISDVDSLIKIYKSQGKSTRTLEHMKDWIDTGYRLKDKKNIENCIHLLVDYIE